MPQASKNSSYLDPEWLHLKSELAVCNCTAIPSDHDMGSRSAPVERREATATCVPRDPDAWIILTILLEVIQKPL